MKSQKFIYKLQCTFKISAFEVPVAMKAQYLALLRIGNVKVILFGGGFGESEIGATHTDVSSHNLCSGNKEHVCPSGPTPNIKASKRGKS